MVPDFIIIGAMKCATSSLHEQLSGLTELRMSVPKEPCFFSDDENFDKGLDWYRACFQIETGEKAVLYGESSTHYTKAPTYLKATERMMACGLTSTKFVYVIRDPIDRLISQYIHEWTQNQIVCDINDAVCKYPRLINYSRYCFQLQPYLKSFAAENIKVVFFERLKEKPQQVFTEICDFIGIQGNPRWSHSLPPANASNLRIRQFPLKEFLVDSAIMTRLRRSLVPSSLRNLIKKNYQMTHRPVLSAEVLEKLRIIFDKDLKELSVVSNIDLTFENYHSIARSNTEIVLSN